MKSLSKAKIAWNEYNNASKLRKELKETQRVLKNLYESMKPGYSSIIKDMRNISSGEYNQFIHIHNHTFKNNKEMEKAFGEAFNLIYYPQGRK